MVEQDRKLEAVRSLLQKTHQTYRTAVDNITVRRDCVLQDTLTYFLDMPLDKIKRHLKVRFADEPGVDEGGLLTELFTLFFDEIFSEKNGLFESGNSENAKENDNANYSISSTVLPACQPDRLEQFRAVGVSMVKALYEEKRIGGRLCPFVFKFISMRSPSPNLRDLQYFDAQTAKSLQWMLVTSGHFMLTYNIVQTDIIFVMNVTIYS